MSAVPGPSARSTAAAATGAIHAASASVSGRRESVVSGNINPMIYHQS